MRDAAAVFGICRRTRRDPMSKPDVTLLLTAWRAGDRAASTSCSARPTTSSAGSPAAICAGAARPHPERHRPRARGLVGPGATARAGLREPRSFLRRCFSRHAPGARRPRPDEAGAEASRRARRADGHRGDPRRLVGAARSRSPRRRARGARRRRSSPGARRGVPVFGGLTIVETAAALGVSHTTVSEDWRFARAWLHNALVGEPGGRAA